MEQKLNWRLLRGKAGQVEKAKQPFFQLTPWPRDALRAFLQGATLAGGFRTSPHCNPYALGNGLLRSRSHLHATSMSFLIPTHPPLLHSPHDAFWTRCICLQTCHIGQIVPLLYTRVRMRAELNWVDSLRWPLDVLTLSHVSSCCLTCGWGTGRAMLEITGPSSSDRSRKQNPGNRHQLCRFSPNLWFAACHYVHCLNLPRWSTLHSPHIPQNPTGERNRATGADPALSSGVQFEMLLRCCESASSLWPCECYVPHVAPLLVSRELL